VSGGERHGAGVPAGGSGGTAFEDVAIVMITMNEEGSIRRLADDLRRDVPGATITIVDSSSDRTPEIAREAGIEVVRQFPPKGYGPAMIRALHHPGRPIVVTLDCDDTYPTERIGDLVQLVRSGCDVAGAARLSGGRPAAMPRSNYYANRLFNIVASVALGRRVRDVHSGMRAYTRETIHGLDWLSDAPALPVELLLAPMRAGLRVREIPIAYRERIGETTLDRVSSTIWTFRRIVRARRARLTSASAAAARPTPSARAGERQILDDEQRPFFGRRRVAGHANRARHRTEREVADTRVER
jgi:glycosyltransferase involved in cell wall biosynthesis